MTDPTYDSAGVPIREDILVAHRDTWRRIARPGNWFDGPTRVAIAAETRTAPDCALCAERKAALSPYSIEGTHDSVGPLPAEIVEIVHRIVTDPGRLHKQWYDGILAGGTADDAGIVDEGGDGAETAVDEVEHAHHLGLAGDVGLDAQRLAALLPDIENDALGAFWARQVINADSVALGGRGIGRRGADSAATAADDNDTGHRFPAALPPIRARRRPRPRIQVNRARVAGNAPGAPQVKARQAVAIRGSPA